MVVELIEHGNGIVLISMRGKTPVISSFTLPETAGTTAVMAAGGRSFQGLLVLCIFQTSMQTAWHDWERVKIQTTHTGMHDDDVGRVLFFCISTIGVVLPQMSLISPLSPCIVICNFPTFLYFSFCT